MLTVVIRCKAAMILSHSITYFPYEELSDTLKILIDGYADGQM